MDKKPKKNIGASVRNRLRTISRQTGQSYELLLTRYALERLLYRLSVSRHARSFVLKGAMLLMTWLRHPHRGTRDLDLLGFGDSNPETMKEAFAEILQIPFDDGVLFDVGSLSVDRIREQLEYGGVRLVAQATIDGARVKISIDIGFGDAVEPGVEDLDYPVMLDFPVPRLRAYARETVIAEKFQAIVMLGRANTRMKDFYDIWIISQSHEFNDDRLARAIKATFERRKTEIPGEAPFALTREFANDVDKQRQWDAFLRNVTASPGSLQDVIDALAAFLMPHAIRAADL